MPVDGSGVCTHQLDWLAFFVYSVHLSRLYRAWRGLFQVVSELVFENSEPTAPNGPLPDALVLGPTTQVRNRKLRHVMACLSRESLSESLTPTLFIVPRGEQPPGVLAPRKPALCAELGFFFWASTLRLCVDSPLFLFSMFYDFLYSVSMNE